MPVTWDYVRTLSRELDKLKYRENYLELNLYTHCSFSRTIRYSIATLFYSIGLPLKLIVFNSSSTLVLTLSWKLPNFNIFSYSYAYLQYYIEFSELPRLTRLMLISSSRVSERAVGLSIYLNPDKTEVICLGTTHRRKSLSSLTSIQVADASVSLSHQTTRYHTW